MKLNEFQNPHNYQPNETSELNFFEIVY